MRSTNKEVVKKIQDHILEYGTIEEHSDNVQALLYNDRSIYQAIDEYVVGGSFLVYFCNVEDFLNSLGINPENKQYSDKKIWNTYRALITRELVKMLDKQNK